MLMLRQITGASLLLFCSLTGQLSSAFAQSQTIPNPNREEVFQEDTKDSQRAADRRRDAVLAADAESSGELDFKAPSVEYLRDKNQIRGDGGAILSRGGVQVQAEDILVDLETNDAVLDKNLVITGIEGSLSADRGTFNLDSETGEFDHGIVSLEEGAYTLGAERVDKISEFGYKFFDSHLTTCGCSDDESPWVIRSDHAHVTQEGYAHTYHTTLEMYGVPFFYTPYLAFPVKTRRASGLLVPEFGYSSEDGIMFSQPIFGVIDDSTDFTITPFVETNTRAGSSVDFRKSFSRRHSLATRWVYSNESQRDGELRGTNTDGLDDPQIDTDRFGGFVSEVWRGDPKGAVPWAFVSDIHYVSDNLFLRELDDDQIGEPESRYATSQMLLRGSFGDYVSAEGGLEYNQALVDPQETTLQRLPSLAVVGQKSFRPFGYNPYGVKVVSQNKISATSFSREESYDGERQDVFPTLSVPFHFSNYLTGQLEAASHQTFYQMRETFDTDKGTDVDFDEQRSVYIFSSGVQTAVEKVYDLEEGNSLSWLTGLGSENQSTKLARVKHLIEPFMRYAYVPDTSQDDLPLYDGLDRIRERSLVTYGFRTSLQGRFLPTGGIQDNQIAELTPRVEDLPLFSRDASLPDLGMDSVFEGGGGNLSIRQGEIREIAAFTMKQSYDYIEDQANNDADRSPFSDVYGELSLFPTKSVGFRFDTNYNSEEHDPSSWGISTTVRDDRGDSLTARYSYIAEQVSQIEGNAELVLTDRVKLGYYGRFDELESEFLVHRVALRFSDSCRCWFFDVGMSERLNPDRQVATVSLTLVGLGDITQKMGLGPDDSGE